MKNQIDVIDAIPSKRIFWSIISDYDLNKAICELIDNAIDMSIKENTLSNLSITIEIDKIQRMITVEDNAGGVKKSDIQCLVSPGKTTNKHELDDIIGLFGVGTKRAVFALAQDIKITTRYSTEKTYRIEIDDKWLEDEDWHVPLYEYDEIDEGKTIIELNRLRFEITDELIGNLREHLSTTYALFIKDKSINIKLNEKAITGIYFENWAYPPNHPPQKITSEIKIKDDIIKVEIIAGLANESSPVIGDYGVFFYCNKRLIVRGMKNYEVGFAKGLAGKPHPNMSLARIIISLSGKPGLMPWNSSKSDINAFHPVFIQLRNTIIEIVKYYTSLSRRLEGEWEEEVFKYESGEIKSVSLEEVSKIDKTYFLPLPKTRENYLDKISSLNKTVTKDKPWTRGLCESMIAVDVILKQKLEQKNRIALIILDSTIEIAYKEFLVNDSGASYSKQRLLDLFKQRQLVEMEVEKYVTIPPDAKKKIKHYYDLRCTLIHERANSTVSDSDIQTHIKTVQEILTILFKLNF